MIAPGRVEAVGKACKNISHIPSPFIFSLFDDASAFTKSEAFQSLGCRRRVWKWKWWRVKVKVKESSFKHGKYGYGHTDKSESERKFF